MYVCMRQVHVFASSYYRSVHRIVGCVLSDMPKDLDFGLTTLNETRSLTGTYRLLLIEPLSVNPP